MNSKSSLLIILLLVSTMANGQANLHLHPLLHLPKDSLISSQLTRDLEGLLGQKNLPNNKNEFILQDELLATSALVDELKDIERSGQFKDSSFYKCYLMNVASINKADYILQLSYLGTKDNMPYHRASFKIIAHHTEKGFRFASPLTINTMGWKRRTIHNYNYYYKHSLDEKQANAYVTTTMAYDHKLKAKTTPRACYYADNMPEALAILGIDYKLDYNGYNTMSLSSDEHDSSLVVGCNSGTAPLFDPHDLWHARLRKAMPGAAINKPVDEGCAFLYGGSWGLTWSQIYNMFEEKVASKPGNDWLSLYESDNDFGNDKYKPLLVTYMINAFIVQQLEKEKGFDAVKTLLACGRYEKTNAAYFKTLESLTGINRSNFNERIGLLIKQSGKS